MKIYKRAILPIGFRANGVACGIKKAGKLDLALFYSDVPARAAALFTTNKLEAAPIKVNKRQLKSSRYFRAIIVNSGNANCFTGWRGLNDAEDMIESLSGVLKVKRGSILVNSTGIIGKRLPLLKIKRAIPVLARDLSDCGIKKAKQAIMTTDKFTKEVSAKFNINNRTVTICGIAKGAGMVAPDLATMLCFILTDANITQRALSKGLKVSVDNSFNCITVDGCMSTNDSVMVLANGTAKNKPIDIDKNFNLFFKALKFVCLELAKLIVKDAEGATRFIQIKVRKAKNFQEAKKVALSIANSNLFKTAVYGQNPNFGRIIAAVGASGIDVREKDLKIKVSPLYKKEIDVEVSLNRGNLNAVVYTSDLTPEYVKINAEYN